MCRTGQQRLFNAASTSNKDYLKCLVLAINCLGELLLNMGQLFSDSLQVYVLLNKLPLQLCRPLVSFLHITMVV